MNPTLEIFSQGEEVITGQIADTNAMWLSQQAVKMGFSVYRHTAVGDKLDDLVQVLLDISKRADCCICTGGLGPTSDDLTTEAVAIAFNIPLLFDEVAFTHIQQFFHNRNRQMPECNRKQALLPKGSTRLDNPVGTAPGFALQHDRCWFVFIPGVPSEMRHLFFEHIQPGMLKRYDLRPNLLITIKTTGIGESDLQERINKLIIPSEIQLGFRAELGEVQIKLLFPNDYPQEQVEGLTQELADNIGDTVYAIEGFGHQSLSLVTTIDQLMIQKKFMLTTVETVSHGLLAAKLVGVSWLLSGIFEQSLNKLSQSYNVEYHPEDLVTTAQAIGGMLLSQRNADMVLIQLASGEDTSSFNTEKPLNLVNFLITHDNCLHTARTISGNIERKQTQAAMLSLDLLRRFLQGKEIV
jgi:nicotinamide-nucleotide amidase